MPPPPGFQKEPPQRVNDPSHHEADLLGSCESCTPWLSLNALSALACRSCSLPLSIPCHREDYSAQVITKWFWVC